jgi:transposase
LPERRAESTEPWLRAHPGAKIIRRERASLYAEAATKAAPQAVQVADRWHLLRNLSEAFVDTLRPHHRLLSEVARVVTASEKLPPAAVTQPPAVAQPFSRAERLRQQNRERRLARYEAVIKLAGQGLSQREITRQCRLNRTTVRRWVSAGSFPERKPSRHPSTVACHREYLETRWLQGCRNAAQLWRELRARGFAGRPHTVRDWSGEHFGRRRCQGAQPLPLPAAVSRASPRQVIWLLLEQPQDARPYIEELCRRSPKIASCAALAREFFRIVRQRHTAAWPAWRQAAASRPFSNFVKTLLRDESAFLAALQHPGSNGPVAGHIHRLKLIKRSMYGPAKFDLLRIRVLNAA